MDLSLMKRFLPMHVTTAQLTLTIAVIDIAVSVVIGIAMSLALYYWVLGLRQLVAIYVELSHNTSLLVQLFFLYFGLPKISMRPNPEFCGIIGLSFLGGVYMTETLRTGLEAVEWTQSESTFSLDMSQAVTMCHVVLPQAVAVSAPSPVASMVFLIKETSVFNDIILADLMYTAKDLVGIYYQTMETPFMLAIAYLMLLLPTSLFGS